MSNTSWQPKGFWPGFEDISIFLLLVLNYSGVNFFIQEDPTLKESPIGLVSSIIFYGFALGILHIRDTKRRQDYPVHSPLAKLRDLSLFTFSGMVSSVAGSIATSIHIYVSVWAYYTLYLICNMGCSM